MEPSPEARSDASAQVPASQRPGTKATPADVVVPSAQAATAGPPTPAEGAERPAKRRRLSSARDPEHTSASDGSGAEGGGAAPSPAATPAAMLGPLWGNAAVWGRGHCLMPCFPWLGHPAGLRPSHAALHLGGLPLSARSPRPLAVARGASVASGGDGTQGEHPPPHGRPRLATVLKAARGSRQRRSSCAGSAGVTSSASQVPCLDQVMQGPLPVCAAPEPQPQPASAETGPGDGPSVGGTSRPPPEARRLAPGAATPAPQSPRPAPSPLPPQPEPGSLTSTGETATGEGQFSTEEWQEVVGGEASRAVVEGLAAQAEEQCAPEHLASHGPASSPATPGRPPVTTVAASQVLPLTPVASESSSLADTSEDSQGGEEEREDETQAGAEDMRRQGEEEQPGDELDEEQEQEAEEEEDEAGRDARIAGGLEEQEEAAEEEPQLRTANAGEAFAKGLCQGAAAPLPAPRHQLGTARRGWEQPPPASADLHISGPCLAVGVLYAPPAPELGPLEPLLLSGAGSPRGVALLLSVKGEPSGRCIQAEMRRVRGRWMLHGVGPWLRENGAEEGDALRLALAQGVAASEGRTALEASLIKCGAMAAARSVEQELSYVPSPAAKALLRRLVSSAGAESTAVPLRLVIMDEPDHRRHRIRAELRRGDVTGRFSIHGIGAWLKRRGARPGDEVRLDVVPGPQGGGASVQLGIALRQQEVDGAAATPAAAAAAAAALGATDATVPSPVAAVASTPTGAASTPAVAVPTTAEGGGAGSERQGAGAAAAQAAGAAALEGTSPTPVCQTLVAGAIKTSQVGVPLAAIRSLFSPIIGGRNPADFTLVAAASAHSSTPCQLLPVTLHSYDCGYRLTGLRLWLNEHGALIGDTLRWEVLPGGQAKVTLVKAIRCAGRGRAVNGAQGAADITTAAHAAGGDAGEAGGSAQEGGDTAQAGDARGQRGPGAKSALDAAGVATEHAEGGDAAAAAADEEEGGGAAQASAAAHEGGGANGAPQPAGDAAAQRAAGVAGAAAADGEPASTAVVQTLAASALDVAQLCIPQAAFRSILAPTLGACSPGCQVEFTIAAASAASPESTQPISATLFHYDRGYRVTGLRPWLQGRGARPGDRLMWQALPGGKVGVTLTQNAAAVKAAAVAAPALTSFPAAAERGGGHPCTSSAGGSVLQQVICATHLQSTKVSLPAAVVRDALRVAVECNRSLDLTVYSTTQPASPGPTAWQPLPITLRRYACGYRLVGLRPWLQGQGAQPGDRLVWAALPRRQTGLTLVRRVSPALVCNTAAVQSLPLQSTRSGSSGGTSDGEASSESSGGSIAADAARGDHGVPRGADGTANTSAGEGAESEGAVTSDGESISDTGGDSSGGESDPDSEGRSQEEEDRSQEGVGSDGGPPAPSPRPTATAAPDPDPAPSHAPADVEAAATVAAAVAARPEAALTGAGVHGGTSGTAGTVVWQILSAFAVGSHQVHASTALLRAVRKASAAEHCKRLEVNVAAYACTGGGQSRQDLDIKLSCSTKSCKLTGLGSWLEEHGAKPGYKLKWQVSSGGQIAVTLFDQDTPIPHEPAAGGNELCHTLTHSSVNHSCITPPFALFRTVLRAVVPQGREQQAWHVTVTILAAADRPGGTGRHAFSVVAHRNGNHHRLTGLLPWLRGQGARQGDTLRWEAESGGRITVTLMPRRASAGGGLAEALGGGGSEARCAEPAESDAPGEGTSDGTGASNSNRCLTSTTSASVSSDSSEASGPRSSGSQRCQAADGRGSMRSKSEAEEEQSAGGQGGASGCGPTGGHLACGTLEEQQPRVQEAANAAATEAQQAAATGLAQPLVGAASAQPISSAADAHTREPRTTPVTAAASTNAHLSGCFVRLTGQQAQLLCPELAAATATTEAITSSVVLAWSRDDAGGGHASEAPATLIRFRPDRDEWRLSLHKDTAHALGGDASGGSTRLRLWPAGPYRVRLEVLPPGPHLETASGMGSLDATSGGKAGEPKQGLGSPAHLPSANVTPAAAHPLSPVSAGASARLPVIPSAITSSRFHIPISIAKGFLAPLLQPSGSARFALQPEHPAGQELFVHLRPDGTRWRLHGLRKWLRAMGAAPGKDVILLSRLPCGSMRVSLQKGADNAAGTSSVSSGNESAASEEQEQERSSGSGDSSHTAPGKEDTDGEGQGGFFGGVQGSCTVSAIALTAAGVRRNDHYLPAALRGVVCLDAQKSAPLTLHVLDGGRGERLQATVRRDAKNTQSRVLVGLRSWLQQRGARPGDAVVLEWRPGSGDLGVRLQRQSAALEEPVVATHRSGSCAAQQAADGVADSKGAAPLTGVASAVQLAAPGPLVQGAGGKAEAAVGSAKEAVVAGGSRRMEGTDQPDGPAGKGLEVAADCISIPHGQPAHQVAAARIYANTTPEPNGVDVEPAGADACGSQPRNGACGTSLSAYEVRQGFLAIPRAMLRPPDGVFMDLATGDLQNPRQLVRLPEPPEGAPRSRGAVAGWKVDVSHADLHLNGIGPVFQHLGAAAGDCLLFRPVPLLRDTYYVRLRRKDRGVSSDGRCRDAPEMAAETVDHDASASDNAAATPPALLSAPIGSLLQQPLAPEPQLSPELSCAEPAAAARARVEEGQRTARPLLLLQAAAVECEPPSLAAAKTLTDGGDQLGAPAGHGSGWEVQLAQQPPVLPPQQMLLQHSTTAALATPCVPALLPAAQPGELRLCGLTFHPDLAPGVRDAMAAWEARLNSQLAADGLDGGLEDAEPEALQIWVLDGSALAAAGVREYIVKAHVAKLLGFESDFAAPLPQHAPHLGPDSLAPGRDEGRGGGGLFAVAPLPRGTVLGVLGGYVWPQAAARRFASHGYRCLNEAARAALAERAGGSAGGEAAVRYAWKLLEGSYRLPMPGSPEGWELSMLGHGGFVSLINDPRREPRGWADGNDVDDEDGAAARAANCTVVPISVRGLALPVVVALRDIAPGEQLLRDYGADWWRQHEAAWAVAEHFGIRVGPLLQLQSSRLLASTLSPGLGPAPGPARGQGPLSS